MLESLALFRVMHVSLDLNFNPAINDAAPLSQPVDIAVLPWFFLTVLSLPRLREYSGHPSWLQSSFRDGRSRTYFLKDHGCQPDLVILPAARLLSRSTSGIRKITLSLEQGHDALLKAATDQLPLVDELHLGIFEASNLKNPQNESR